MCLLLLFQWNIPDHAYTLRVFFFKKKPRLRKIEARSNDVGWWISPLIHHTQHAAVIYSNRKIFFPTSLKDSKSIPNWFQLCARFQTDSKLIPNYFQEFWNRFGIDLESIWNHLVYCVWMYTCTWHVYMYCSNYELLLLHVLLVTTTAWVRLLSVKINCRHWIDCLGQARYTKQN